ncbi:class I SAM-dependent methyltransferase [Microbacterium sp. ET2]|uniref:class I SAM-dependent DNA methyltransferase n=1 Tax=Microbacterium albipurpureum TaxID=3050384 RepID=UPI00259D02CA|nr:class I SAM-dependent methyltransferase [Microbacterium sp. ET2 (Ac-2212)]WJL97202.1 class I SAM-dependent methyltransferase [Microbacterium sp. ET2 (Ac-2212)]
MRDELREQTRGAYNVVAADYAAMIPDTSFEAPLDLAMIDEFVRRADARPSRRVLDAGCGAGRMLTHLQSASPRLEVTGVDLSEEMIALAQQAHPTARFVHADITDTPFEAEQFDAVLAWYSIIHLAPPQLQNVVTEFARLLAPGGLILLSYHVGAGERQLIKPYGHDIELRAFLHQTDGVVEMLAAAGFGIIARLDRSPRKTERHAQGFVLAERR